jgi:enamine deaminase RidA (YjgF/YER057c/UK114 family)
MPVGSSLQPLEAAAGGLRVLHLPWKEIARHNTWFGRHGLGIVAFDWASIRNQSMPFPFVHLDLPWLGTGEPSLEIWLTDDRVASGSSGCISYRHSDSFLFGCLRIDEEQDTPLDSIRSPLQEASYRAYSEMFTLVDRLGYSHLLRIWNYFPDINRESHGLERYRQFNIGRQDAFLAHGRSLTRYLPAACALGTRRGPLTLYFIASRQAPIAVENPRQTSAFLYPRIYGPRSPTFSRATLLRTAAQEFVFVSGTASIVGHRSEHGRDVGGQTRETLANIACLIAAIEREHSAGPFPLADLAYKVYVRNREQLPEIRAEIELQLSPRVRATYLEADICRSDLLVEIEAITAGPRLSASSPSGL